MKRILFIFTIISCIGYTQNDKSILPLEIVVSGNQSQVKNDNTENRFGFGAGIHYSFFDHTRFNLITGIEYNQTNQLKKYWYFEFRPDHIEELTYKLNSLTIPLGLRTCIGKKYKAFLFLGGYADFPLKSQRSGTYYRIYSPYPGPDYSIEFEKSAFSEYFILHHTNYGLAIGLGSIVPIGNIGIIIDVQYRNGLVKLLEFENPYQSGPANYERVWNSHFQISIGVKSLYKKKNTLRKHNSGSD